MYFFGPVLDSSNCKVVAECDCCSDDILFFNDTEFVKISYCVPDMIAEKGTYVVNSKKLVLNFSGVRVGKSLDEASANRKGKTKYTFKTEKIKPSKIILTSFYCKKVLFYKTKGEDISYGSKAVSPSIGKRINELKTEGLWSRLFK